MRDDLDPSRVRQRRAAPCRRSARLPAEAFSKQLLTASANGHTVAWLNPKPVRRPRTVRDRSYVAAQLSQRLRHPFVRNLPHQTRELFTFCAHDTRIRRLPAATCKTRLTGRIRTFLIFQTGGASSILVTRSTTPTRGQSPLPDDLGLVSTEPHTHRVPQACPLARRPGRIVADITGDQSPAGLLGSHALTQERQIRASPRMAQAEAGTETAARVSSLRRSCD
jgi:hypothetical protein